MRVKSYKEAVTLARCAGEDAANRRMRTAGRRAWSAADHEHAAGVTSEILCDLGFDVASWTAMAGMPRNEPPEVKLAKKRKSRAKGKEPVQLSFSFV